jgi:hypothetical protein
MMYALFILDLLSVSIDDGDYPSHESSLFWLDIAYSISADQRDIVSELAHG